MWRPSVSVLRHRDLALYIGTGFLRTMALQIQATALAWQIYEITRDPFQLALVGLVEFLPAVALAQPAGHLADHVDRRRIILVGTVVSSLVAEVLYGLAATVGLTEATILALALAFGIVRAVTVPAALAIVPSLVPREDLSDSVAWSSTTRQVAAISGPGIGGLLYAVAPQFAYGGAMIGFAGAAIFVFLTRPRPVIATVGAVRDRAAILAGMALIFRSRLLLGAISLDLFAVLFSGATALIPIFAQDILHVGADAGGLLRSGQSLGAAMTAFLLTQFPLRRHVGRRLFVSIGVFGLAAIVFGLSHNYWLSFSALLVL
ncbi:MAG: MFS transporter, partial [Alphaproteobacteria bacterium]|nr:MFS transporter [Alphaproteobacteria bacterium]